MKYLSELGMVLVTILWGANYVTCKLALDLGMTPNFYTALRFCGAAVVLALIFHKRLRHLQKDTLKAGIYIGLAVGIGYVLQTVGLTMTTAAKAGFLTGLYVVLVPVLDCILKRILPKVNELIGVAVATVGLAVLSLNADLSIGTGDIIVFISAIFFAVSIIMIDRFAAQHDPVVLSVIQIAVSGILGLALGLATEPVPTAGTFSTAMIALILYAIFFGSAVNTTVQNVAQSKISPTTAALILVLEPVFSGLFAFLFLHEPLGIRELSGSGLIIAGMLFTLLYKPKTKVAKRAILPPATKSCSASLHHTGN